MLKTLLSKNSCLQISLQTYLEIGLHLDHLEFPRKFISLSLNFRNNIADNQIKIIIIFFGCMECYL